MVVVLRELTRAQLSLHCLKRPDKWPACHAAPVDVEKLLKAFDLTGKYGPCTGLPRLERHALSLSFALDIHLQDVGPCNISISISAEDGSVHLYGPAGGSALRSWA